MITEKMIKDKKPCMDFLLKEEKTEFMNLGIKNGNVERGKLRKQLLSRKKGGRIILFSYFSHFFSLYLIFYFIFSILNCIENVGVCEKHSYTAMLTINLCLYYI